MLGAPSGGRLKARGPDAAAGVTRRALFLLIGAVGDRVAAGDHGGAEVAAVDGARGDRAAVTVLLARAAGDRAGGDQRAQRARGIDPARPRPAAPEAGLAIFRGIDAVEADLHARDDEAVAVDHLRTARDIGSLAPGEPAGGGERGERQRNEREHAHVARDARVEGDRLTSTSGTRPAFDYELLRQFAQNRLSAAIAILLLIATVGFLSGLWTGPLAAGIWTVGVLAIHAAILAQCRRLLAEAPADVRITTWRARFVLLDLCFGVAWALNVTTIVQQDAGSGTFMLFVMLLVVAVSSMLASSLPIAMFAATLPVTAAVAFELVLRGDVHDYILAAMAVTAQGYFTMLAHRLY